MAKEIMGENFNKKIDWNWSETLLAYQNAEKERSFCDLKFTCTDGYILVHKVLIPVFNSGDSLMRENALPSSPHYSDFDPFSAEIVLPTLNLSQASKLILLMYTGETLITRAEQKSLKPLFEAFQLTHLKRVPFPPTSIPNTRNRAKRSGSKELAGESQQDSTSAVSHSTREALALRKIRGVQWGSENVEEDVYIFGDGSINALPISSQEDIHGQLSTSIDNGIGTSSNNDDTGYFCSHCSFIFCDNSDFIAHSIQCPNGAEAIYQFPLPATSTVIKMEMEAETNCIKMEGITGNEVWQNQSMIHSTNSDGITPISTLITVCLICVTACKDAAGLIVHSSQVHHISPEKDYDYGTWKCKRCNEKVSSNELSAFLQHVHRCKREKRKRSSKEKLDNLTTNKRQRTSSETRVLVSHENQPDLSVTSPSHVDSQQVAVDDVDKGQSNHQGVSPAPADTLHSENIMETNPLTNRDKNGDNSTQEGSYYVAPSIISDLTPKEAAAASYNDDWNKGTPKVVRTMSLSFNPLSSSNHLPSSALPSPIPHLMNTSDSSTRSFEILTPNEDGTEKSLHSNDSELNAAGDEEIFADKTTATVRLSRSLTIRKDLPSSFHSPNPQVIYKGSVLNSSSKSMSLGVAAVLEGSKSKTKEKNLSSNHEKAGQWIKRKKHKKVTTTSSLWNCRSCKQQFSLQKDYMMHPCQGSDPKSSIEKT